MAKFMTDKELKPLQSKAGAWDSVVAAVLKTNSEIKTEDVTAELIIEAITSNNATDPDLQNRFDILQRKYDNAVLERDELQTQVNNLLGSAAEDPGHISSGSEVTGKTDNLSDFANKHKGDTAAILEQCQKEGLI